MLPSPLHPRHARVQPRPCARVQVVADYRLTASNALSMSFSATTDMATFLNLCKHGCRCRSAPPAISTPPPPPLHRQPVHQCGRCVPPASSLCLSFSCAHAPSHSASHACRSHRLPTRPVYVGTAVAEPSLLRAFGPPRKDRSTRRLLPHPLCFWCRRCAAAVHAPPRAPVGASRRLEPQRGPQARHQGSRACTAACARLLRPSLPPLFHRAHFARFVCALSPPALALCVVCGPRCLRCPA